jgi:hypothetical protein
VTVQAGDSWLSVRNRLFPLDVLRQANPGLDAEILRPGDTVHAPYVQASELARERAARGAVERQLADVKARLSEFQQTSVALEASRRELAAAERSVVAWHATIVGLVLAVTVLIVLLAVLLKAVHGARRRLGDVTSHHRALRASYDELRRSLHDIDVKVQGRVVSLLQLHGGKVVTDAELSGAVGPVVAFTRDLKARHDQAA